MPFIRYFWFLFTLMPDWDQEVERFPSPVEAFYMFWNSRDVLIFDFIIIGITVGVLLFLAPYFTDQMI